MELNDKKLLYLNLLEEKLKMIYESVERLKQAYRIYKPEERDRLKKEFSGEIMEADLIYTIYTYLAQIENLEVGGKSLDPTHERKVALEEVIF